MLAVYAAAHVLHAPAEYIIRGVVEPARESPARAEVLLAAVRADGHPVIAPRDFGLAPIGVVHGASYLTFLQTAHAAWRDAGFGAASGGLVVPHAFAVRQPLGRPGTIEGQVGYHLSGNSVPIDQGTWTASLASAHCALEAGERVRAGEDAAYAICRPPGHHAYGDLAGGFCYLNNAAIAAEHLRTTCARVAILDVDVHHGNGTQGVFYARDDVHFVSTHADPNVAFPYYAGYASERGEGDGLGHTLNLPLPLGTTDAVYLDALRIGLESIRGYAPDVLVVSLGLDGFCGDPSGLFALTTPGFRAIGQAIGALRLPSVLIQEGGYAVDALGANLSAFLSGFLSTRGA